MGGGPPDGCDAADTPQAVHAIERQTQSARIVRRTYGPGPGAASMVRRTIMRLTLALPALCDG
jgi:hypothetical protein